MQKSLYTAALAAAALVSLGGACGAQTPAGGASTLSAADKLFLVRAADGNMAEVMTSQMALMRGQNPQIKQVAQMLIMEHGQAQQELTQLAGQKGVTLPPTVGQTHQILGQTLSKENGGAFDKSYIGAQVEDHENTIALFQQEIASGQDQDVKAYAAKYLPKIVGHTTMIYGTALGVGSPVMQFRPTVPPAAAMMPATIVTTGSAPMAPAPMTP